MTAIAVYRPEIGPIVYGWDSACSYGSQIYDVDKRGFAGDLVVFTSGTAAASTWIAYRRPQRKSHETPDDYLYSLALALGEHLRAIGETEHVSGLAIAADCAWYWSSQGDVREILRGHVEGIGAGACVESAWYARDGIEEDAVECMRIVLEAVGRALPGAVRGPYTVMVGA